MTAVAPFRMLAGVGIAAVFAAAVHSLRVDGPPDPAMPVTAPAACTSCDARHARLQGLQAPAGEVTE